MKIGVGFPFAKTKMGYYALFKSSLELNFQIAGAAEATATKNNNNNNDDKQHNRPNMYILYSRNTSNLLVKKELTVYENPFKWKSQTL